MLPSVNEIGQNFSFDIYICYHWLLVIGNMLLPSNSLNTTNGLSLYSEANLWLKPLVINRNVFFSLNDRLRLEL